VASVLAEVEAADEEYFRPVPEGDAFLRALAAAGSTMAANIFRAL